MQNLRPIMLISCRCTLKTPARLKCCYLVFANYTNSTSQAYIIVIVDIRKSVVLQ